ncbi:L-serine ammonia-lyase [Sphingobium sp. TCM1]|uniref:L-serine ammonia-lyase n=1 Tax=Sphingobium sp. TCM1 TaxID=453246 RepID=UPI0007F39BFE|nr:L-serine ammonia-lyase [Sphingobium sp. TCM1]OAN56748.1 L-serine ammonia-lyase [Sphingobium sp. TCM1]
MDHLLGDLPAPARARSTRALGLADLFAVGIGPSSSHTVGPMRAAWRFAEFLARSYLRPARIECTLFGSLALTGRGHLSDVGVLLGLSGWTPDCVDPDEIANIVATIRRGKCLALGGRQSVAFCESSDLRFDPQFLPEHPNGLRFIAWLPDGTTIEKRYFSIGGGAVIGEADEGAARPVTLRFPFSSGADLLEIGRRTGLGPGDIVRENESAWRSAEESDALAGHILAVMDSCIDRGLRAEGLLPGGLRVPRRAGAIYKDLQRQKAISDPAAAFEWTSLWALAVNEENAAGGRVVTAPTNGAAGVLPAVIRYYRHFITGADDRGARYMLYTAAAIGMLYKMNASISAAEMGCQGEVGVACSMAAAALAAAMGGSNAQIENAAEIGMEHNLGLTCDPIGGLVQIPCIERNTMGAVKAINAAYLALRGNGAHHVSLDAVIETMRQTGEDMKSQYKETSLGGLAVNAAVC